MVRSKQVSAAAIEAARALSLIVRAGAGVNTIAIEAASRAGVFVANCPGQNAIAVAELTPGLAGRARSSHPRSRGRPAGRTLEQERIRPRRGSLWPDARCARRRAIGQAVIGRGPRFWHERDRLVTLAFDGASRALGCRGPTAWRLSVCRLRRADRPCRLRQRDARPARCHGPVIAAAGALLINAGAPRSSTVQLRTAIAEKGLRVALDVFDREPDKAEGTFADDIVSPSGVYGTHHIGASTEQAQTAIADETLRIVSAFVQSGEVPNCVNVLPQPHPARAELIIRHFDRVGVPAEVLGRCGVTTSNVEAMHNTIFDGSPRRLRPHPPRHRPNAELKRDPRARRHHPRRRHRAPLSRRATPPA